MKHIVVTLLLILGIKSFSVAQVGYESREAEPVGGSSKLALRYFKIDFTARQREILVGREIELIFSIDTIGNAVLEDVNGVTDEPILDSLRNVTLPMFYPRVVDDIRQESLYFLKLKFPSYETVDHVPDYPRTLYFKRFYDIDDFEYIHKSGRRMDVLIGGVLNGFAGSAAHYSGTGGGMRVDMTFIGKQDIGFGMTMVFYGNPHTGDYPITTARAQNPSRVTLLLGGVINKLVHQKDRKEVTLQLDLAYALQNIITKTGAQPDYYVQIHGFSPGVSANLALPVGRERLSQYYGMPNLFGHYVNFHAALRPIFYNLKQASGLIWEAGVSYRLKSSFVDEFRLKQVQP